MPAVKVVGFLQNVESFNLMHVAYANVIYWDDYEIYFGLWPWHEI